MRKANDQLVKADEYTNIGNYRAAELAVQIADRWLTVAREISLLTENAMRELPE